MKINKYYTFLPIILLSLIATGLCAPTAYAQTYKQAQETRPDQINNSSIKSVLLYREGTELSDPVLFLNEQVKIICEFDDMDADYKDYKYTVVHCDPWWKPTEGLERNDYISSYYADDDIRDSESSYNTITPFIHYSFSFPEEGTEFLLSGNYLLKVYEDGEDVPVFTRGFMVAEHTVGITGKVAKSANPAIRPMVQQVMFNIDLNGFYLSDPFRNLEVVVSQNGRWDNAIRGVKPRMVLNNKLQYDQEGMFVFNGYNEFRFLDLKGLHYLASKVSRIEVMEGEYAVYVDDTKPSRFHAYKYKEDINGKFLIHTEDGTDSGTESEYVHVKLYLPWDRPIAGGELFVTGAFCNWQYLEENRAMYSPRKGGYLMDLFLKQGYYNYTYAVVELGNLPADAAYIDGSFADAQNLYTISAYYREPGDYHYRLIGRQVIDSAESF